MIFSAGLAGAASLRAAEPQPAEALDSLLKKLEAIKASPQALDEAKGGLGAEIGKIDSELKALAAEIQKIEGQLAEPRQRELELRRRLKALEAGQALLEKTRAESPAAAPSARGAEIFGHVVGPAFDAHCARCHNPETKKGGLDLSTREAALKGGEGGPAILPGKPDESPLYRLVARLDEPGMPYQKPKLPDDLIAAIKEWIALGAPFGDRGPAAKPEKLVTDADREGWAFRPLPKVAPPQVKNAAAARNPVDLFIQAKLEEKGIEPNAQADRRALLRRAYFDLTGLPPTPEEAEAFLRDPDPQAYDKLVDRLLDSPRFGERWARHWLDIARFAESHGYEQDYDRPFAYTYRDFVIKAFNQDLPYDKFVEWQIAGDEFAPNDPLAVTATGFLGAGTHSTQITKSQVEKERYDELDDMAGTMGTAMLGLTIGCARCHDHKYDPIPTKDYYRVLSNFTTTVRSNQDVPIDAEGYAAARARWEREFKPAAAAAALDEQDALPKRFEKWLGAEAKNARPERWTLLDAAEAKSQGGATLAKQPDGSLLAGGANPQFDVYTVTAPTTLEGITAIRVEALADPSLPKGGPGRADNGNFDLTDLRVTAAPLEGPGAPVQIRLTRPRATFEQAGLPAAAAVDGDKKSGWAVDPKFGEDHAAVFELDSPLSFEGGMRLSFTLEFSGNDRHAIGRLRLSACNTAPPPDPDWDKVAALVEKAAASLKTSPPWELAAPEREALLRQFRRADPKSRQLAEKIFDLRRIEPKAETVKAMICSEGVPAIRNHTQGGDYLERTHFLQRGNPNQKGEVAPPGFLQLLERAPQAEARWRESPPPGCRTTYQRRSLANWLADADQGAGALLARVIVNRLWHWHFGRGIVSTPSDFGKQGEPPTHPELIDWLAGELIRGGWKLKPIHKLIMASAAYMRASAEDESKAAADRADSLWWRFPRQRLEAEEIRDSMLAVSGRLDPAMFGPGTLDPEMRRRSVYFFVKRSRLIPMMTLFDAPDTLGGMSRRPTTTVAPQALLLMNNKQVREWAEALAARIAPTQGGAPEPPEPAPEQALAGAVRAGYMLALAREPQPEESGRVLAFLRAQADSYRAEGKPNPDALAMRDFAQALFGLNEFAYIE